MKGETMLKKSEISNNGVDSGRLQSLIERVERLEDEKKAIAADIRDIFTEAKNAGFDVKIMRLIIKLSKLKPADRDEQDFILKTYRKALNL